MSNKNEELRFNRYHEGYEAGYRIAYNKIYTAITARIKELKSEILSNANADVRQFKEKILAYSDILTFMKNQLEEN
jgi:hypothetical protein